VGLLLERLVLCSKRIPLSISCGMLRRTRLVRLEDCPRFKTVCARLSSGPERSLPCRITHTAT